MRLNNFSDFRKNLKDKKVFIWGLGLNRGGLEAVKFFCRHKSIVTVVDLKSKEELKETIDQLKRFKVNYLLGDHDEKTFVGADLIIKNPAISWEAALAKKLLKKYQIETDVTLFFKFFKGPIVGITGSKGKTTTTTLISESLKKTGHRILLGGNLRVSLFSFIKEEYLKDKKIIAVLELSSFQLEDLDGIKKSPNLAVVTNILRDHLNRYGNYANYIAAKQNICRFQNKRDALILNNQDKKSHYFDQVSKAKKIYFSGKKIISFDGYFSDKEGNIFLSKRGVTKKLFTIRNPILRTEVNLKNTCATMAVLGGYFRIGDEKILAALEKFKGVPYRMEIVRKLKSVTFINDTTATIPDASMMAIKNFKKNLILIAGGADKDLKFDKWAEEVSSRVKFVVLFEGSALSKIKTSLRKQKIKVNSDEVSNMDKAVKLAYKKAVKGDVILLSPGCASFGVFKNEFDRGDQFNEAVKRLR